MCHLCKKGNHKGVNQPTARGRKLSINSAFHLEINKSEMQQPDRSARNTAAEPEQRNLERAKKRLSSFTPPPSGSVPGQRSSADRGVSEWIPWPDLDGPPKPQSSQLDVDFENLSEDSVKKCKKLADMGFDLRRVVKVTLDINRCSKVSSHLPTDLSS